MPCQPGTLAHRTAPGRITVSRIAAVPDAGLAEVVIDRDGDAWARRLAAGTWAPWRHVAHVAEDIAVCAYGAEALVSVVTFAPEDQGVPLGVYVPPVTRRLFVLTADGLEPAVGL